MSKRLTIPDNSVALILSHQLAADLFSLCQALRKPRKAVEDYLTIPSVQAIAGDVLLAILESKEAAIVFRDKLEEI